MVGHIGPSYSSNDVKAARHYGPRHNNNSTYDPDRDEEHTIHGPSLTPTYADFGKPYPKLGFRSSQEFYQPYDGYTYGVPDCTIEIPRYDGFNMTFQEYSETLDYIVQAIPACDNGYFLSQVLNNLCGEALQITQGWRFCTHEDLLHLLSSYFGRSEDLIPFGEEVGDVESQVSTPISFETENTWKPPEVTYHPQKQPYDRELAEKTSREKEPDVEKYIPSPGPTAYLEYTAPQGVNTFEDQQADRVFVQEHDSITPKIILPQEMGDKKQMQGKGKKPVPSPRTSLQSVRLLKRKEVPKTESQTQPKLVRRTAALVPLCTVKELTRSPAPDVPKIKEEVDPETPTIEFTVPLCQMKLLPELRHPVTLENSQVYRTFIQEHDSITASLGVPNDDDPMSGKRQKESEQMEGTTLPAPLSVKQWERKEVPLNCRTDSLRLLKSCEGTREDIKSKYEDYDADPRTLKPPLNSDWMEVAPDWDQARMDQNQFAMKEEDLAASTAGTTWKTRYQGFKYRRK